MRGQIYVIDEAKDRPNPEDGYDIVKSTMFNTWKEARDAFAALPIPPIGTTFYLGRVEQDGGATTMACKSSHVDES